MAEVREIKWIRTGGGPLICIEKANRNTWLGASRDGTSSDYKTACEISEYCSVIDVRGFSAIVFGDMPLQTGVLNCGKHVVVMRLMYIDYVGRIYDIIQDLCSFSDYELQNIDGILIRTGVMVMFDSAYSGIDYNESIEFQLAPGKYSIHTGFFKPDSQTYIVIHKLVINS